MALPSSTNLHYFSATVMNAYAAALLAAYDWATGPQFPFRGMSSSASWSGYILHTSDTFRYKYIRPAGGETTLSVNGTPIHTANTSGTKSGTVDISGLSLTVGQVYPVTLTDTISIGPVHWLGETKTINYTAPPTFADTDVLTPAQLETLKTGIEEIESALNWPIPGVNLIDTEQTCRGYNDFIRVALFSFYYSGHDLFNYRFIHGTKGVKVESKIFLDSNEILNTDGEHTAHKTWASSIDVSGLGFSLGDILYGYLTSEHDGTAASAKVSNEFYLASLSTATACTPPPVWEHGGTNVNAANLNRYSTIINAIHPGAPAPTYPLYYEQPAVATVGGHEFYIQHRRRWLRYKGTGATVTVRYGPNMATKADIASGTTAHASYDLGQIPGLTVGSWYRIDDCEFAQEWTASQ